MASVTIRSLVKETAIYGISGVLARSLGLLLLPVLSNLLPLDQFGHYKLTYVLIGLLQLFLVFGMGNSLVRYLIGAEDEAAVFSSHFWPILAVATLGCLAIFSGAAGIASVYFAKPLPGDALMIRLAALVVWFDTLNTLPYSLLRAKSKPILYTLAILFSAAIYAGLVVFLL
ncbi:MAG TPA: oligosaccharide flippase family protein, partial [Candidatus Glassbacteria bacterium]|nr:oligosaccharide flippase family protein [Candidatus Glassbacteria bacterium]